MAGSSQISFLRRLFFPVIVIFFILFSVSRDEPVSLEFVNVPCSSAIVITKDFGTSSLSAGTKAPERQSIYSLGQTAIFSKSSQIAGLNSHNGFSYNDDIGFLRIYEREVRYDLVISSSTGRSPPLSIS